MLLYISTKGDYMNINSFLYVEIYYSPKIIVFSKSLYFIAFFLHWYVSNVNFVLF